MDLLTIFSTISDTLSKQNYKSKYVVVPIIFGFNEDKKLIYTIDDKYIATFKAIKDTNKTLGFTSYILKLKEDMEKHYANFIIAVFIKIKDEYIPLGFGHYFTTLELGGIENVF